MYLGHNQHNKARSGHVIWITKYESSSWQRNGCNEYDVHDITKRSVGNHGLMCWRKAIFVFNIKRLGHGIFDIGSSGKSCGLCC